MSANNINLFDEIPEQLCFELIILKILEENGVLKYQFSQRSYPS